MGKNSAVLDQPQTSAKPARRTFYSRASGLVAQVTVGHLERDGEKMIRVGQKHASFSPIGGARSEHGGDWGQCITSDAEVIAYLEERAARPPHDVVDEQGFLRMSAPAAVRDQVNERTIEQKNRLIADLQRQLAEKPQAAA